MLWQIDRIVSVCQELIETEEAEGASSSELIAAAFVLDRMAYLPTGYAVVDAWESLNDWQVYVKRIRHQYMHLIKGL